MPYKSPSGIIPADAGSTAIPAVNPLSHEDHPRGCGEHMNELTIMTDRGGGSSPRMRGAPVVEPGGHPYGGIIPADAGSTR